MFDCQATPKDCVANIFLSICLNRTQQINGLEGDFSYLDIYAAQYFPR
jgi:hypothetical protein